jgi:hypothetical protein
MKRLRILSVVAFAAVLVAAVGALASSGSAQNYAPAGKPSCLKLAFCTEVDDPYSAFHTWNYVGHDEPSVEFYSNRAGAGNNMTYEMTLPNDPSNGCQNTNASAPGYGNSCNVMLHPAFWFGMDMCATQSYPEQLSTCTPDSDNNVVNPAKTTKAPGVAFEELQFYAPGWVPQFANSSCDPTRWCVALNIDSLSEDPINGTTLNPTCQSEILGGTENINFAYLTDNGIPVGPPNPLQFDVTESGNPQGNPPGVTTPAGYDSKSHVFFLNSGDDIKVSLFDTANGLETYVQDLTRSTAGYMIASAANHFGQINYAPTGTSCTETDYNFHPMFSTSSTKTRTLWAAHSYNVAFADELGHFDWCSRLDPNVGNTCGPSPGYTNDSSIVGMEGKPGADQEPAESITSSGFDDFGCFAAAESLNYQINGCVAANTPGFDGAPYLASDWPNGSNNPSSSAGLDATAPDPVLFTSPLINGTAHYTSFAFEDDLPRIEASDFGGSCNRTTGVGCTNPPPTDDGASAFYPYYTLTQTADTLYPGGACLFALGDMASAPSTVNSEGGSSTQAGAVYPQTYYIFGGGGATHQVINDYNSGPKAAPYNTCGTG